MPSDPQDSAIARIEDDLRASRTQAWDVEEYLAKRHQAKIDALTEPATDKVRAWTVAKELAWQMMAIVGCLATITTGFLWMLTGQFPLHEHSPAEIRAMRYANENPIPPPLPGK